MKQLVSRNPIERFKLVVKAQNGTPLKNFKAGKVLKGWKEAGQYDQTINGLTAQLKDWLDSQGINYTKDAGIMQASMVNYLAQNGNINHGLNLDGHWGDQSGRTLNAILAQMPADYKRKDTAPVEDAPVVNTPVVDAPYPFGYKTANTYEGDDFADKLKRMGIRSNADLINFMHNSRKAGWKGDAWQTQFRNDVDRALGGDYSDANIRKTFHTKNGWGRGFLGGGDYADFQNALQTNAGIWNGMYDGKESNARMNAIIKLQIERMTQRYIELHPIQTKPLSQEFTSKYSMYAKPAFSTLGIAGAGLLGNNLVTQ